MSTLLSSSPSYSSILASSIAFVNVQRRPSFSVIGESSISTSSHYIASSFIYASCVFKTFAYMIAIYSSIQTISGFTLISSTVDARAPLNFLIGLSSSFQLPNTEAPNFPIFLFSFLPSSSYSRSFFMTNLCIAICILCFRFISDLSVVVYCLWNFSGFRSISSYSRSFFMTNLCMAVRITCLRFISCAEEFFSITDYLGFGFISIYGSFSLASYSFSFLSINFFMALVMVCYLSNLDSFVPCLARGAVCIYIQDPPGFYSSYGILKTSSTPVKMLSRFKQVPYLTSESRGLSNQDEDLLSGSSSFFYFIICEKGSSSSLIESLFSSF